MMSEWRKGSVRAPESLWKDLHRRAAQYERGINSQLETLLREVLARRKSSVRR
jgi:hypothetical protein